MASQPPGFGNGKGGGGGNGNAPFSSAAGSALADHLPPQNLEAERWLLGGILLDNEVLHEIAQFLTADDFYRDAHQVIYRAISELYSAGKGAAARARERGVAVAAASSFAVAEVRWYRRHAARISPRAPVPCGAPDQNRSDGPANPS